MKILSLFFCEKTLSRRRLFLLRCIVIVSSALLIFYAFAIEPRWLKVNEIALGDHHQLTLLHFSDLHYKGDKKFLDNIIQRINELSPDIVCFTGDFTEDPKLLPEILNSFSALKSPVFAVPGNHEFCYGLDLAQFSHEKKISSCLSTTYAKLALHFFQFFKPYNR